MERWDILGRVEIAWKGPTAPSLSRFQDLLERQIHGLLQGRL